MTRPSHCPHQPAWLLMLIISTHSLQPEVQPMQNLWLRFPTVIYCKPSSWKRTLLEQWPLVNVPAQHLWISLHLKLLFCCKTGLSPFKFMLTLKEMEGFFWVWPNVSLWPSPIFETVALPNYPSQWNWVLLSDPLELQAIVGTPLVILSLTTLYKQDSSTLPYLLLTLLLTV